MKRRFGKYSQRIYYMLMVVAFLLFALTASVLTLVLSQPKVVYLVQEQVEDDITKSVTSFVTGMDVNQELEMLIAKGYGEIVYEWFDRITGNRVISMTILHSALMHGIPAHLSFSQTREESRFTYNAIGYNRNDNGDTVSRDFGLKQLNEFTFQYCSYSDMLDVEYNIATADAYLVSLYKKYNKQDVVNGWDRALMAYNRGNRIDERGMRYVQSIRNYERYLDKEYNTEFPKFFKMRYAEMKGK
jgi:hypothetical protein